MVGGLSFRVLCSPVGSRASAVSLTFIAKQIRQAYPPILPDAQPRFSPRRTVVVRSCRTVVSRRVLDAVLSLVDQKADMDEEERKARDQQLRSSIHTKLIESGEYDK